MEPVCFSLSYTTLTDLIQLNHPLINYFYADDINQKAIKVLEDFGQDNPQLFKKISECIATTKNGETMRRLLDLILKIATDSDHPDLIQVLSDRIDKITIDLEDIEQTTLFDKDLLCWSDGLWKINFAEALGQVSPQHPKAVQTLLELILTPFTQPTFESQRFRLYAAHSLGKICPNHPMALQTLIDIINTGLAYIFNELNCLKINHKNYSYYFSNHKIEDLQFQHWLTVFSLEKTGEIADQNSNLLPILTPLLKSPDEVFCLETAKTILSIDPGNITALDTLVKLHYTIEEDYYSRKASDYFLSLAKRIPEIQDPIKRKYLKETLINFMQTNPNPQERIGAAKTLGEVMPGLPQTVEVLIDLIKYHSDQDIRQIIKNFKSTLKGTQFERVIFSVFDPSVVEIYKVIFYIIHLPIFLAYIPVRILSDIISPLLSRLLKREIDLLSTFLALVGQIIGFCLGILMIILNLSLSLLIIVLILGIPIYLIILLFSLITKG